MTAAVLGRIVHRHRGQGAIYSLAKQISANLNRSQDELLDAQDQAISCLVDYAYQKSPYYRRKYDAVRFRPGDVRGRADLAHLPEITKPELLSHMDEILTEPKQSLYTGSSGGTTGIQLIFYRSAETLSFRRAIDVVVRRYYGWREGQWQGWLWGASMDLVRPVGLKNRLVQSLAERTYFFDASHICRESYSRFVEQTISYKPTYVSAYPSLAFDLAERISTGEVDPVRMRVISLTAEPLYPFQREAISEYLADEVFERYGSRECGMVGIECPEHNGLHIFTESVCCEAVDPESGTPGKNLLITDLLNFAMPLIRYHTGDLADIDYTTCNCGRSAPRLRNIQGRETETLWRVDGSGVAGLELAAIIRKADVKAHIQLVQDKLGRIRLRVGGAAGSMDRELSRLIELLREEMGPGTACVVEYVERIERASSGKFRNIVSNVTRRQAQEGGMNRAD